MIEAEPKLCAKGALGTGAFSSDYMPDTCMRVEHGQSALIVRE